MKIITAPEYYTKQPNDICVFLAGGITNCKDWQSEVIKNLEESYVCCGESELEHLVIFNPRRADFPIDDKSAAYAQIEWEFYMLEQCDIFTMYFASGDSVQPICLYELGRYICRMQMRFPNDWEERIIITSDFDYKRYWDVYYQVNLATNRKIHVNTSDSLLSHSQEICLTYFVELRKR